MCGILGISGKDESGITKAAETIRYRGPDMHGSFADEHISLGFNRLAIIDLDERANQPMWDAEKKTCIVFNGEIYNYRELKKELESTYTFRTTSDTEVILAGYVTHGPDFIERLRGMFAYAIYDVEKKKVILARDHAGIKPLYFFADGETFAFASEIKALKSLLARPVTLNMDALRLYWALGYIPSPQTAYTEITALLSSSYLTYDLATKKCGAPTRYKPDAKPVTSENDLFELIEEKVMSHLVADVPVGLFFSGGTDSSVIAAALKRRRHPLEAFSIKIAGRNGDEKYFRAISEALGLNTHVYDFGPKEFVDVYEEVMGKLDIPLADNSIFPTYFVAKKAREKVTVVLSGEGGDELFFGYPRQQKMLKIRGRLDRTVTIADRLLTHVPVPGRIAQEYSSRFEPVSYYIREMSPARNFLTPEFLAPAKVLVAGVADALYFDRDLYLENDLLRKTDLATMYNSLEGRVPLLDPDIIASAPNFEKEYNAFVMKPLLKKMLERDLPHELVYRGKSGFGMDLKVFFAHPAVMNDLQRAFSYFKEHAIPTPVFPDANVLLEQYPNAAFAAIALYRALQH
ncbi:MAG TPA: asparagine synthase (glutamine-hydrolyzing) [Pyrinomonadaceae bacterium]|jgi:asparagine synthase (glutamine-hydrolysing)|nr:asparagine synthase (glutamine-hydrolyzing) [Pyrinomonadaceae bacterium]